MTEEEIREAANSAAVKAPSDRESFIKESYQSANLREIELIKRLADKFDELSNNYRDEVANGHNH